MFQPQLNEDITFTRPSRWVWYVSLAGKQVGTVRGDSSCGFIAKDLDNHCVGLGYFSAEAAMQSLGPRDGQPRQQ